MRLGLIVPQGWTGDYDGWDPRAAWLRTVAVSQLAERLGFESIWLFDHFHTVPKPTDELTFESFTSLSALAASTSRVRLGHIVICTAFRNPALTAKMISTMDVISGGRMELGIGAGWKRDEWLAYGYGFPKTRDRLAALRDHLEVITRMLEPGKGHATFEGEQHADELNVDGMSPDDLAEALPVIAARCEEIGRDPATLPISVHLWWGSPGTQDAGQRRVDLLGRYADLGVSRVMGLQKRAVDADEAVEAFAADARAAGVEMADAVPA